MKLNSLFSLAGVALETAETKARATVEFLHLDYVFTGTSPARPSPALRARFEAGLAANTVRVTLDATQLTGPESLSGWYLNLNPRINPASLTFRLVATAAHPASSDRGNVASALEADGAGFYDLYLDFPPPPGTFSAKFTSGEKIIVDVYRAEGLTTSDFLLQSFSSEPGSNRTHSSAAHVSAETASAGSALILALFLHRRNPATIPAFA